MEAGGVHQEHRVGGRDEDEGPRATVRQAAEPHQHGCQGENDVDQIRGRHRRQGARGACVHAHENAHQQQAGKQILGLKVKPPAGAPDRAGHGHADDKEVAPATMVFDRWVGAGKGEVERQARERNHHHRAKPRHMERGGVVGDGSGHQDAREGEVGKQAEAGRAVEEPRHLGLDLLIDTRTTGGVRRG